MNPAQHPNLYCPIRDVMWEIMSRQRLLSVTVFQEELVVHVAHRIHTQEDFAEYRPSFFREVLEPKLRFALEDRYADFAILEALLFELEMAFACCRYARAPFAKPIRELILRALAHCVRFDEIRQEERRLEAKLTEDRRRGGKARQAKLECARQRAARLILVTAPAGGFQKESQAAHAIETRLAAFVKRRRLAMTCEASFRRTIVRWIHQHPSVRAAYLASRGRGG